jgi:hypothetical protein
MLRPDERRFRARVGRVTARQGKIVVAATVLVLSTLLFWQALATGAWVGFAVTEVQVLAPMGISWRVLSGW